MRIFPLRSLGIVRRGCGDIDHKRGIADILLARHIGNARGLGFEMETLDAERRNLDRSKPARMFSMISMVMPGPLGGHCQTS